MTISIDHPLVPNQKHVLIKKTALASSSVNAEHLLAAARELNGSGLKLWAYLSSKHSNSSFALSPVAVQEAISMPRNTYKTAVSELIDKGFLIQNEDTPFYFFVPDNTLGGRSLEDYLKTCE